MFKKHKITQKKSVSKKGFTLVELMIVVVIIAVIAGLTLGEINSDSYQLKSRAHTLKAHMMQAKLEAVKRDLDVKIAINDTSDGYAICAIDSAGNIVTTIVTIRYANKFTFAGGTTTFSPRGTSNSNSFTIVKKDTTNPEYSIITNNIGRVRLEKTKN